MRHDSHFVEELARRSTTSIGRFLPIAAIVPNPEQPRTQLGQLDELTDSIREKGVLEPILVRAMEDGHFQIISGERRYRAATAAGLDEIPAIELDVEDNEVLEIALIENIQRKDLTAFEEAEGYQFLKEKFNYTHDRIAKVIGKSRTTITETLQLNDIPERIRGLCREAGISSKSVLVQIARAASESAMEEIIGRHSYAGMSRGDIRRATQKKPRSQAGRPRNFKFELREKDLPFRLSMSFRKSEVGKEEIIESLERVLERLRGEEG